MSKGQQTLLINEAVDLSEITLIYTAHSGAKIARNGVEIDLATTFDFSTESPQALSAFLGETETRTYAVTILTKQESNANVMAETNIVSPNSIRWIPDMLTYADRELYIPNPNGTADFIKLLIDGVELVRDVDYTAEDGSTVIDNSRRSRTC